MMGRYILDSNRQPVPCEDLSEWERWLEDPKNRLVVQTKFGEVRVSTIFLGFDHRFGDGPPLLFETQVFGGEQHGNCWRYSTWDEAEAGHEAACLGVVR